MHSHSAPAATTGHACTACSSRGSLYMWPLHVALLCLAINPSGISTYRLQAEKQQQQQQQQQQKDDRKGAAQAAAAQTSHSGDQRASQSHGGQQHQPEASTSAAGSQGASPGAGSQPGQQQQAQQRPPLQVYRSPKAVDPAAELPVDVSVGSLRCVPHPCLPRLIEDEPSTMSSTPMQVTGMAPDAAMHAGTGACARPALCGLAALARCCCLGAAGSGCRLR